MPTEPKRRGRRRNPNTEPRRNKNLNLTESVCAQLEAQAAAAGLRVSQYVTKLVREDAKGGAKR